MVETRTLRSAHAEAIDHLSRAGSPTPELDVTLLIEHTTGLTALDRLTRPDQPITPRQMRALDDAVARRMSHEPVHRIIGWREFYGLPLSLNAHTLVPRPDTESLIDLVLPFVQQKMRTTGHCRFADLGTGSGAIALAILHNVPGTRAVGTDIAPRALEMAARNAQSLGLSDRVEWRRSDWLTGVDGTFDLIVSNPPYIATPAIATLEPDVRDHDPALALDGGSDGLAAYRTIAAQYDRCLAEGGAVAVEIGAGQKHDVTGVFAAARMRLMRVAKDLNGRDRALFFAR